MHLPKPEFQNVPANGMPSFGGGGERGKEGWADDSEPVKPMFIF
jgi:hypothetical protein